MITVIGNMKGGTGKSTVSFNLAVWLAHKNKALALYDLDPQQTFADVIQVRTEENYEPALPASKEAHQFEEIKQETADHILIDVSMSNQEALKEAVAVCDQIIVPVAPSQADIWSTQRFLKIIKEVRGENLPKIHGIINRADTHPFVAETKETEEALDFLPNITRVEQRLHNRTAYRRSFSEGLGVFELQPYSKASQEFKKVIKHIFK